MQTQTLIRLVVGLSMTAIIALFALRRILWLVKLTLSGQRVSDRTKDIGTRIWTQIAEVFGQRRLLKWSIPGLAHFFTMWGFFILITVYIEAYGTLFQPNFHIPIVGRWDALGFLQDFPDYWTQGETLDDLKDHLRDLYMDLTSGQLPGIRKVDELVIS